MHLVSWGIISAACLMQTTAVEARELPATKMQGVNLASQSAQRVTTVTGWELEQTNNGLQIILQTAPGGERLVPLILPQGNSLAIDLQDAALGRRLRNGLRETNPAPGISLVRLERVNERSIRLTITGEERSPSAEIVPGGNNLVLSITPAGAMAESEPDEVIEITVTGEAEDDDYNVDNASIGTRTDTPIEDVPQSIQIIPQEVIKDQQVTNFFLRSPDN